MAERFALRTLIGWPAGDCGLRKRTTRLAVVLHGLHCRCDSMSMCGFTPVIIYTIITVVAFVIVLPIIAHTKFAATKHRKQIARHAVGPLEAVSLHDWRTAFLGALTDAATDGQVLVVVVHADGGVHTAEEELQVGRALDAHQRPELVHLFITE